MHLTRFQVDQLAVEVHESRQALGAAAARAASEALREALARCEGTSVVLASAASQNEFLAALRADRTIDWSRIEVFHLDEYVGLPASHPASFRRYLRARLVDHVPVRRFHELRGDSGDPEAECARYQELLRQANPGLAALGIGENGHLAFIDPNECDFSDPKDVRSVGLDRVCRMQQVHDGAFPALDGVPRRALSLTIPVFLRIPRVVLSVPGATKRAAVMRALEGPVAASCPASVLRRHPGATLFLDRESAALVNGSEALRRSET
ncbi:MAG: glucosamine-6-phosphate deaminase [Bryobacteraceae bacterium]